MKNSLLKLKNLKYPIFIFLLINFSAQESLYSQSKGYPVIIPKERIRVEPDKKKEKVFFPDNYSDLDEPKGSNNQLKSKEVNDIIEQARQKYLQALILIQKKDTSKAAKYFDDAILKLYKLYSIPNIEQNQDFTDLAQSIIDDYENYVKSISYMDENSPAFIINELINKEIEKVTTMVLAEAQAEKQAEKSVKTKNFGSLPKPPDSLIIPLTEHSTVDKSIAFLTNGTGKKIFKIWLERSSKWFPLMVKIAKEEKMPQEIIYLSMIESGMSPSAVSSAKAVGLWQFIRPTGELYELNSKGSVFIDERKDPEKSTRAAMRHLRDLYNEFNDWHLALAAYNCGAGCVARAIKKTNKENPDYWEVREKLPPETRAYVPKFISAAKIAMDPENYGFKVDSLKFQNEFKYDIYQLDASVNLDAVAKAANTTVEEIKALNPELIMNCTPPDMIPYKLKIPQDTKKSFTESFALLTSEEKEPFLTHIVQNKESIKSIASRYNIDQNDLISLNKLNTSKIKLKKGQELKIPVNPTKFLEKEKTELALNKESETKSSAPPVAKFNKHKVKHGETLFSLARDYSMDVARLRKINGLDYKDKITVDQEIYVEGELTKTEKIAKTEKSDLKSKTLAKNSSKTVQNHKIKKGETLAQIADDYNVSISDLKKWNNIKNQNIIAGQILKIKSSQSENTDVAKSKEDNTRSKPVIHKVKSGETLGIIAAKYGVTEKQLKSWNEDVLDGNTVFSNTRLKVYSSDVAKGSAQAKPKNVKSPPKFYTIRSGDNLSKIARKFGVTVNSLVSKNKSIDESNIKIGQSIRIQ